MFSEDEFIGKAGIENWFHICLMLSSPPKTRAKKRGI